MKRNKNLDILRAISILIIVIYHIYAVTGIDIPIVSSVLKLGGEIGVTSFLILSGFSIYLSLDKTKGEISYFQFIKNRLKRLLPEYYFCLIISLFLMGGAAYLSKDHIFDVLSHFALIHNLFSSSHGSINGALWTLGVIFQFYLVAKLFYKGMEKHSILVLVLSILFTISSKVIVFEFLTRMEMEGVMLFIYGRQLPTALDNFILGMFICHWYKNGNNKWKIPKLLYSICGVFLFIAVIFLVQRNVVYSNTWMGYSWHTLLAISLSLLFFTFLKLNIKKLRIVTILEFIAKYEYGIYLWHLLIIYNLIDNAPIIKAFVSRGYLSSYIIIFIISVGGSLLLSIIFNNSLKYTEMKKDKKIIV